MGQFTNQNDDDTDDDTSTTRPPSPETIPQPPTDTNGVQDLTIPELLRYTRNALQRTIHSKYAPNVERCDAFYKGGRERKNLAAFGTEMGTFEPGERAIIRKEVIRWALGTTTADVMDEEAEITDRDLVDALSAPSTEQETLVGNPQHREKGEVGEEAEGPKAPISVHGADVEIEEAKISAVPHRPRGCEAYEALSASERLQFCIDILVPEAALQLLAWQEGYRFDVPMIPPYVDASDGLPEDVAEQERELHEKASQLTLIPPPSEWVNKIMSVRSSRRAALEARGLLHEDEDDAPVKRSTGSFSRPNAGRKL